MVGFNRQVTTPRKVNRSKRNQPVSQLTSMKPGVVHPIDFIPVLREDRATGRVNVTVEMMETKELLANGVQMRISAWFWPWLAAKRFQGSADQFDRSWMKKPKTDDPGETMTPFFTKQVYGDIATQPVFNAWGHHFKATDGVNTHYIESYNGIQNWRQRNASKELAARLLTDTSLAPAFWTHTGFEHIVPDFDQAVLQGEVALEVVEGKLPVQGIGLAGVTQFSQPKTYRDSVGGEETIPNGWTIKDGATAPGAGQANLVVKAAAGAGVNAFPDIYAEFGERSIVVSLANIKKAQALQSWAEERKKYEGHDDDAKIDMAMAGLTLRDEWLKDPIPLDEDIVTFQQGKRYSSTAGELDDSAVSGVARGSLKINVPQVWCGGMIVLLAEILPVQLFERQSDPFMFIDDQDDLPDAMRDSLDTEKVDIVVNRQIDIAHTNPNDTFGYEPMNAKWNRRGAKLGGNFLKKAAESGNTAARNRIWAVEAIDPVLTEDFYIAKDGVHTKPFLNDVLDPFQIQAIGNVVIDGLTQFGGKLVEATGNYDKLVEATKDDKIEKD